MVTTKAAPIVISVEDHAEAALSWLGYENETYGHWRHMVVPKILYSLPNFVIRKYEEKARKVFMKTD